MENQSDKPDFDLPNTECHKKGFFDLESIQRKLGITQTEVEIAWANRENEKPIYLKTVNGINFWISNYTPKND